MNKFSQDGVVHGMQTQDWAEVASSLNEHGNGLLPGLLTPAECDELVAMYSEDMRFRSRIIMARHGFGKGEYKYYSYPLPSMLTQLRSTFYSHLVPIANHWNELMKVSVRYPNNLQEFLERCHAAGQNRPTPLLLKYEESDYNCLHQDLYGEHVFPIQVAILLSRPGSDFTGGEFTMTENGAALQRADVVPLLQGDGVAFTVNQRPVQGKRSVLKVAMRHGVSKIRSGERYTVGLIFHDAL